VFLIGVVWAIVRRYVQRPYRIRIKSKPEHAHPRHLLRHRRSPASAPRRSASPRTGAHYEKWSFIGYPLGHLVEDLGTLGTAAPGLVDRARPELRAFLVILPITMLRHMFTSPLNMYLKDKDRPKGAMKAMPNLMETELESFGASTVEDFTWKQLLDTDACTMCGRCTSVCPAHATGKPLDPREIVLKTGEVMAATGDPASVAAPSAPTARSPSPPTACSSGSPPRRSGPAPPARRATRSARSTSRSSTRSSTCAATCR
jgi:ferredoxin